MKHTILLIIQWFAIILLTTACTTLLVDYPIYTITTDDDGNRASATFSPTFDGSMTLDIISERGIGHINVTHLSGPLAETVRIRLYLNGLEHLQVTAGDIVLLAFVPSYDPTTVFQQIASIDTVQEPTMIDAASPYWMNITQRPSDERTEQQSKQPTYFEVVLPTIVTSDQLDALTVEWIDFYRG